MFVCGSVLLYLEGNLGKFIELVMLEVQDSSENVISFLFSEMPKPIPEEQLTKFLEYLIFNNDYYLVLRRKGNSRDDAINQMAKKVSIKRFLTLGMTFKFFYFYVYTLFEFDVFH